MSGSAWEVARILERHVARVVVVSPADTGIRQARAKTDRLDARTLARLLAAGELDGVWSPDERCRVMRRRLARREQLARARSRAGERKLAEQAEASYKQMVRDWQAAAPKKVGASVTPGRASQKPSTGKVSRQIRAPDVCTSTRPLLAPRNSLTSNRCLDNTRGRRRRPPLPLKGLPSTGARPKTDLTVAFCGPREVNRH